MKKRSNYVSYGRYSSLGETEFVNEEDSKLQEDVATETQEEDVQEETVKEEETPNASSGEKTTGKVTNCTSVNVRTSPSASSEVFGIVKAGTEVLIDLGNSTDEYYKVSSSDFLGYIKKDYVERSTP